jgi:hypothetical protein
MKKLLAIAVFAAVLAGCTTITKVEGEQLVHDRLAVKVTSAWNKVSPPGSRQPYELWTQEGIPLDQLRLWAAVKSGEALIAPPPNRAGSGLAAPRIPTFAANMSADQLVNLFETMYAVDGSLVKVTRVEPSPFAGGGGIRFEFTVARKRDDVQLLGVGWVRVHRNELFAATFVAPRLSFFPRLAPKAEDLIRTAQIKG